MGISLFYLRPLLQEYDRGLVNIVTSACQMINTATRYNFLYTKAQHDCCSTAALASYQQLYLYTHVTD